MKQRPFTTLWSLPCLLTFALLSPPLWAEVRQFTDTSGRVLSGQFVSISGGNVTIRREDGQSFTLKAAAFSAADQAYFKQAMAAGTGSPAAANQKSSAPPKITPKDIRELPYCGTMSAVKLNPKQKDIFDELKVSKSDRIRIHGKKEDDSGRVDGKEVFHTGKLALFPPQPRSGKIISKFPPTDDVRTHFVVLETGDTLVSKKILLGENKTYAWTLAQEGGITTLKVMLDAQTTVSVSAPAAQVTGAGFAATARWTDNEVDVSVTFDES